MTVKEPPKTIKLKVVSDGTPWGTELVDRESGLSISSCIKIEWVCEAGDGRSSCKVTLLDIPIEVKEVEAAVETIPLEPGIGE